MCPTPQGRYQSLGGPSDSAMQLVTGSFLPGCRKEWRHSAAGSVPAGRLHRYSEHAVLLASLLPLHLLWQHSLETCNFGGNTANEAALMVYAANHEEHRLLSWAMPACAHMHSPSSIGQYPLSLAIKAAQESGHVPQAAKPLLPNLPECVPHGARRGGGGGQRQDG